MFFQGMKKKYINGATAKTRSNLQFQKIVMKIVYDFFRKRKE